MAKTHVATENMDGATTHHCVQVILWWGVHPSEGATAMMNEISQENVFVIVVPVPAEFDNWRGWPVPPTLS